MKGLTFHREEGSACDKSATAYPGQKRIERLEMQRREILAAAAALLLVIPPAHAQAAEPMVSGVVMKIDESLGKITLKHGEIPNLHMEAMTMVFAVRDSAMLVGLKAGDKVRFEAEEIDGRKTVTKIQSAR
jgi:Cu(I)/Ag(I) efflux system periplasmic protein CusF